MRITECYHTDQQLQLKYIQEYGARQRLILIHGYLQADLGTQTLEVEITSQNLSQ